MADLDPSASPPERRPAKPSPFVRIARPLRFIALPIAYVISVWMYTKFDGYSFGEGAIRSAIPATILLIVFVILDRKANR